MQRRHVLQGIVGAAVLSPRFSAAQSRVPIADMHSHYGLITRSLAASGLADELRNQRVALMAWKLVADARWIHATSSGVEQTAVPEPGALAAHFESNLARMKAYLREHRLKIVLSAADVDACIAPGGGPGVVLATEGADFLEGQISRLDAAYAHGLRHLQLVHYIRTPVGDFQTKRPEHGGLSDLGKSLVKACNAKGILVDLAHCTGDAVEQALQIAKRPMVWSHSWVDRVGGRFTDAVGYLQRRLSLSLARKIAAHGGVVGLWALGLANPRDRWSVRPRDTRGYANELAQLIEWIGREHVAFGTDIEGVGRNWSVNDYAGVRAVLDHLQQMKLPSETIERVAYGNYARVLKAALG
jgi:membrane dipeptidase